jgi:hypothetical protein
MTVHGKPCRYARTVWVTEDGWARVKAAAALWAQKNGERVNVSGYVRAAVFERMRKEGVA